MIYKKVLLIACLAVSCHLSAQDVQDTVVYNRMARPNALYFEPFPMFISTFEMSYERLLAPSGMTSICVTGGVVSSGQTFNEGTSVSGANAELQVRFYVYDEVRRPFVGQRISAFVAPFYRFNNRYVVENTKSYFTSDSPSDITYTTSFDAHALGMVIGGGITFVNRFKLDAFVGAGVKITELKTNFDPKLRTPDFPNPYIAYNGVYPRFGFRFGVIF